MSQRSPDQPQGSYSHQASDEVYQILFEEATDGIFVADGEGRYVAVNQRGCEMLGYTREELLNLAIQDLIPDAELVSNPVQLDKLQGGKFLLRERSLRCRDGRLLPVEINSRMLSDGRFLGIVRDISERKRTQEQLIKQEHEFRTLMANSPDFIGRYDREARLVYANPALEKLLGIPLEEIRGKTPHEIKPAIQIDSVRKFENAIRQVLETDSIVEIEITIDQKSEQDTLYHHLRFVPEHDHNGQIESVLLIGQDVTEIKETERQYKTLTENYPDIIARLDREGHYLYVNNALENIAGIPAEEFIGTKIGERYTVHLAPKSPQEIFTLREAIMQVFATGQTVETEARLMFFDNERIFNVRLIPETNEAGQIVSVLLVSRDITERKTTALALQESQALLSQAEKIAQSGTFDWDLVENIAKWSPGMHRLFEIPAAQFNGDPATVMTVVHPDDADYLAREIENVLIERRVASHVEYRILPSSGVVRHIWAQGFLVIDEHSNVTRMIGVCYDVTERKQAEEALRASEERYRALYRDNPSMFFTLDRNGNVSSVNAFGASQLGYTIEELEGQSVLNVFHEEDKTAVTAQLQNCLQNPGQINQWVLRKTRKDGSLLWVEEFARSVTSPNGESEVLIVCHDITNRKHAELEQERLLAQIQEQAQQVQNIIDTVPEGVVLLRKDHVVTLTNPAARQYLGLLAPEFKHCRLTHLAQQPLNQFLAPPPKGLWHELKINDLVFKAFTRPVENNPADSGWVLVLRDVTQERNVQQRAQRQERLAAVGQLAAGIAHDFNNILAVIILYAQFVSRTVTLPARARERLHTIEQQAERATALIQQILDFSRQSVLERQPFDLLPFTENLVTLLERTLPENIQIDLEHSAEPLFIQGDPSRIQQAMMNLAVNARDAMPEGGRLRIGLALVQTQEFQPMPVQDLPPGKWVQIKVSDTGLGIPADALSKIFEPFFTTKQEGYGTGLGLAQVYGIVQQHGGYIDVASMAKGETTFTLYFPALDTAEEVVDFTNSTALLLGAGQKVLVVEDNSSVRTALVDSLRLLNYEVIEAKNGRVALEVLANQAAEIDLVLSDVVMPEMGGIALFHALKQQNLPLPIILLTGHPQSKEMENLQALGLAGWLPKPPDLANLSHLIAKALQ